MTDAPPSLDFRNVNALWSSVLVETLVRCGLRQAVISPGSRSTPLAVALVRHAQVETVPILDERSAGFFALGLARRSHRPVGILCTSGTAVANLFPAIVEAHESAVPLFVLTADRPPELRACGSGQTIDQQKIFGSYVAFHHEIAVPEAREELLRYLRQTIAHAFGRALGPPGAPVHLNAPFRDPLPPLADDSVPAQLKKLGAEFFAHLEPPAMPAPPLVAWQRPTTTRGLIVAGPANPRDPAAYVERVRHLAELLRWPILADALSPLRHAGHAAVPVVAHYDAILRNETVARELVPRQVLCLEGWPTSKVLRGWLERSQAEIVLVGGPADNRDALHGRTRRLPLQVESLAAEGHGAGEAAYLELWRGAERAAAEFLARALAGEGDRFEPRATWVLARHLPVDTPLFVASSMPVRDVESFWPVNDRRTRFHFNRGANGIDGTLSSALGMAHGGPPAVALTGDLALLHDTNGFLIGPQLRGSLTIVLINNRGGGIFEHLPIAGFDPPFERFFATPQEVDFGRLCSAYGVGHVTVSDAGHLASLLCELPDRGIRVLELSTDRKADAAARKRLLEGAARVIRVR